ncbi:MAG TPA: hypothetical protein HA254_03760 [Candidatus Diapherotrites archaeon]|uniref:Uncharacterized protein n=1 Tax=Candidatus Iainarchaeum sp. TaxID=3101447 RepID=A0A7J4IW62_9ARCH|nr:hypothetical protein [Candidatus Diapherotrites archaeon]
MSLVTLTFGKKETNYAPTAHAVISSPETRMNHGIAQPGSKKGKLLVKKACRFYSHDHIFVLAHVEDGFITENMKAQLEDREIQIVEVESKFGHNAKKGMPVGVFLSGIDETELAAGTVLDFQSM